jgi:ParB-like chromosome segregation protein Spo0J
MATKLNCGEVKRTDLYWADPRLVVMKEELRGRHLPPKEEEIIKLAISMMDQGQINPVEGHRNGDNNIVITAGFTRTCAARLICDGFVDFEGQQRKDPDFRLSIKLINCSDADAFKRNIVENALRNQTSPMDDALNHERLRRNYGMIDADIMRLYGLTNANRIGRLKKILSLPLALQDQLHNGLLTEEAALLLLELPDDQREEAFKAAIKENGKVDTGKVKSQVREHHLRDADDKVIPDTDSKKKSRFVSRSMKDVRKYLNQWVEGESNDEIKSFFTTFLAWTLGKRNDKSLDKSVDALFVAIEKGKKRTAA